MTTRIPTKGVFQKQVKCASCENEILTLDYGVFETRVYRSGVAPFTSKLTLCIDCASIVLEAQIWMLSMAKKVKGKK